MIMKCFCRFFAFFYYFFSLSRSRSATSFEEADIDYIRDSPRVNELLERVQVKVFDEVRLNLLDLFNEVEDEDAIDRSKPK